MKQKHKQTGASSPLFNSAELSGEKHSQIPTPETTGNIGAISQEPLQWETTVMVMPDAFETARPAGFPGSEEDYETTRVCMYQESEDSEFAQSDGGDAPWGDGNGNDSGGNWGAIGGNGASGVGSAGHIGLLRGAAASSVNFSVPFGKISAKPSQTNGNRIRPAVGRGSLTLNSELIMDGRMAIEAMEFKHILDRHIESFRDDYDPTLSGDTSKQKELAIVRTENGFARYTKFEPGQAQGSKESLSRVRAEQLTKTDSNGNPSAGNWWEYQYFKETFGSGASALYKTLPPDQQNRNGQQIAAQIEKLVMPNGMEITRAEIEEEIEIIRIRNKWKVQGWDLPGGGHCERIGSLDLLPDTLIRQIWSREDGLLDIKIDDENDYQSTPRIKWYTPEQVGPKNADGHYTILDDAPLKEWSFPVGGIGEYMMPHAEEREAHNSSWHKPNCNKPLCQDSMFRPEAYDRCNGAMGHVCQFCANHIRVGLGGMVILEKTRNEHVDVNHPSAYTTARTAWAMPDNLMTLVCTKGEGEEAETEEKHVIWNTAQRAASSTFVWPEGMPKAGQAIYRTPEAVTTPDQKTLVGYPESNTPVVEKIVIKRKWKGTHSTVNKNIDSYTREIYRRFPFGDVLVCRDEGLANELEQPLKRTLYVYDDDPQSSQYGRMINKINPDGTWTETEYDSKGRVIFHSGFYSDSFNQRMKTYNTWDDQNTSDKPRLLNTKKIIVDHLEDGDGTVFPVENISFNYETDMEGNEVEVAIRRDSDEQYSSETHLHIEYTKRYNIDHENPYAAGNIMLTGTVGGTHSQHIYEMPTPEEQANGCEYKSISVSGLRDECDSQQMIMGWTDMPLFIPNGASMEISQHDAKNRVISKEQYIFKEDAYDWLTNDWSTHISCFELTDREEYEYDSFDRVTKTTRLNGKSSSTEWGCSGPLREVDEEGIVTTYAYNSAKRLASRCRHEATVSGPWGDFVIPQQETHYIYDGAGRVIQTVDIDGERVTTTHTSYDRLGRIIREVDPMGRTTLYSYRQEGTNQVITMTSPTGATYITKKDPAGRVISESGTGQDARNYKYMGPNTSTSLGQKEILFEGKNSRGNIEYSYVPQINNSSDIYTRYSYDRLDRPIRKETDGQHPELTIYNDRNNSVTHVTKRSQSPSLVAGTDRITETETKYVRLYPGTGVPSALTPVMWAALFRRVTVTQKTPVGQPDIVRHQYTMVTNLPGNIEAVNITRDEHNNWTYSWTESHHGYKRHLSETSLSSGQNEQITVDGKIVLLKSATGLTTTYAYEYGPDGDTVRVTDPRGNTITIAYDRFGRQTSQTDARGVTTTAIQYDAATGQVSCQRDADGHEIRYDYDIRGRKTAQYGTGTHPVKWVYDSASRISQMHTWREPGTTYNTIPAQGGDITQWSIDIASGLLLSKQYPDGSRETCRYDSYNRLINKIMPSKREIHYRYEDREHQPVEITYIPFENGSLNHNAKTVETFRYDYEGNMISHTNSNAWTQYQYNEQRQLAQETINIDYCEATLTYRYDNDGRHAGYLLVSSEDHTLQDVAIRYDEYGRISTVVQDGTGDYRYQYNAQSGALESVTCPNGMVKRITLDDKQDQIARLDYSAGDQHEPLYNQLLQYDRLNRVSQDTRTFGGQAPTDHLYSYNPRGELVEAIKSADNSQAGNTRVSLVLDHDNIIRYKTTTIEDVDESRLYGYDNIGNYTGNRDGLEFSHNNLNQITSQTGQNTLNTYDADGNQTRFATSTGTWTMETGRDGRPGKYVNTGNGQSIHAKYDSLGRMVSMDGSLFFHVGNRIAAIVNPGNSGADGQSQVKSILWDPTQPSQGVPLNITLNKLFWDSTEVYLGAETFIDTIVETFVVTWMDEDGQTHPVTEMHCETEIIDTILHTEIIGEIIESWVEYHTRVNTRDEARTIMEDDMPVPITWVDEWTEVETWKHDDEGRHVELDYIRHTDTNRARRVLYEYELLGTTVHHDVIGYETESWMEYITQMNTWYETFMESIVHTEIRTEPVYGPFEPVEVPCYYIHDHNKNVVGLSDEHGSLRARYQYDPYGNITRQQGDLARENPIRFSSERWNDKLGIVQYLYRDYNPTSQRWLSRDPIAEQGGMNLYGFVGNDPVNNIDRLGLFYPGILDERPDISLPPPPKEPEKHNPQTIGKLRVESTKAAGGFHLRVCTDDWEEVERPFGKGSFCRYENKWYRNKNKSYCISFAPPDERGVWDRITDIRNKPGDGKPSGLPLSPYPPGFAHSTTTGAHNGVVYEDMVDPSTGIADIHTQKCCCEKVATLLYMKGLVGGTSFYNWDEQNCRTFSIAVFNHSKATFSKLCL